MVLDHEVYCPSLSGGRRLRESIPNVRSGGKDPDRDGAGSIRLLRVSLKREPGPLFK